MEKKYLNLSYDELYGIPLDDYCHAHDVTLDDLIKKIRIDIDLLKNNLKKILKLNLPYPENFIETAIYKTISKKEKHLERILNWRQENL